MADLKAAHAEMILDVAKWQREPDVEHHGQTDDFGARLEVAEWGVSCHPGWVARCFGLLKRSYSDNTLSRDERPVHDRLSALAHTDLGINRAWRRIQMDRKAWVDENERRRFVRLYEYVAALEVELARWTFKYGMTEEALRLLATALQMRFYPLSLLRLALVGPAISIEGDCTVRGIALLIAKRPLSFDLKRKCLSSEAKPWNRTVEPNSRAPRSLLEGLPLTTPVGTLTSVVGC